MDEITAIKSEIAAGKSPTRDAVRAAVAASKYVGLSGPIAFDANGDGATPPGFAIYTCDIKGVWTYQTGLKS
jgi:ABC-type branched-subunit amino acid transport system substrate-binding protein